MTDKRDDGMTLLKELIEARARAIDPEAWEARHIEHDPALYWFSRRRLVLKQARATFAADRALGYKSMRREPTKVMLARVAFDDMSEIVPGWYAMWDAALEPGGSEDALRQTQ